MLTDGTLASPQRWLGVTRAFGENALPQPQLADLVPVVLAGGSGTRLWPESRRALPKHLVELLGQGSLMQQTVQRITRPAPPGRLLTVAAASQAAVVRRQLAALAPALARHLILEPEGRNTAAAVALASLYAAAVWGPGSLLWVCPSDHLVEEPDVLYAALAAGAAAARAGRIVTFGISPTRPETGYGYIESGAPLVAAPGVLEATAFIEKPPLERARTMVEAGGHLWNSGMFLFKAEVMLDELAAHAGEILAATRAAMGPIEDGIVALDPDRFRAVPSAPIDKAVMERSASVAVVPCDPGWSDVGSWQAIWEVMPHDPAGNALRGDAVVSRGARNLVRAGDRLVALAGVDDLAVVETADAVLVARRDDADAVKALVEQLTRDGRPETGRHRREPEAWGLTTRLVERPGYVLVELSVDPGAVLEVATPAGVASWTVIDGVVEVDGERHLQGALIRAAGRPLRLANPGSGPLRLLQLTLATATGDAGG